LITTTDTGYIRKSRRFPQFRPILLDAIIMAVSAGLFLMPGSAQAQVDLPPLELEVRTIEGPSASYRPDTAPEDAWRALESDQTLSRGDHIRTGDETTVTLRVPGISLFKVTPGTRMQLQNLSRSTEQRGLLTTEEVTVNDIEIETEEGQVQNAVREHEGVATEYDLKTPNAVAGVRGTDFQCEVTDFGRTECAVGQGEVRFASRANPDQAVTLQAGQKSGIGPDETTPSAPENVSDTEAQQLDEVAEASRQALALPPTIESLQLNGTAFQDSIRIQYTEPTELTLSGQARTQAEGTSLESVTVSVDGTPVSVEGTEEWTLTRTPAVPEEGSERTATIEITASDANDNSITRTVTVTLVNPEQQGEAPDEIPPENYEEGNVPVEVTTVAGRAVDNLEFPYHAYQGDATSQGLMIEGTASGEATLEGVAYSLDGGNEWQLATGSENWQVPLPSGQSGEYTVEVVAWTTDGVIGEPVEIGPIEYEAISYSQEVRNVFTEFWSEFENENVNNLISLTSDDFIIEFADGFQEDRSQFENAISNNFFPDVSNFRVDYTINQVFGTPNGGELVVNRLEWEGRFDDDSDGQDAGMTQTSQSVRSFESFPNGDYKFIREPNGSYRILSVTDFSLAIFVGANSQEIGILQDGYGLFSLNPAIQNVGNPSTAAFAGQIIIGLDGTGFDLSADTEARLFVNNGNYINCSGCTPESADYPVVAGGITQLNASRFEDITRIPEIGGGRYQDFVKALPGNFYAVNVRNSSGFAFTYIIHVIATSPGVSAEVEIIKGVARDDGKAVTNFRGANPLD
jgi:hypothetical protein